LGGTQSLHTNSYDEALALPTEHAAKVALRTQQVVAFESGVPDSADPLGGSYLVEDLTGEIEQRAAQYIEKIDGMGGAVAAIEAEWIQDEIHESAFRIQQAVESGDRVVVGVNRYQGKDEAQLDIQTIDESEVEAQKGRVRAHRAGRDPDATRSALAAVTETAQGTGNLLYHMRDALRAGA